MNVIPVVNEITCPHLDANERCGIYETRPSCCRNYPRLDEGMFCNNSKCVYDTQGNLDCASCKDKCCEHLRMEAFDLRLLDMNCEECKETYCSK